MQQDTSVTGSQPLSPIWEKAFWGKTLLCCTVTCRKKLVRLLYHLENHRREVQACFCLISWTWVNYFTQCQPAQPYPWQTAFRCYDFLRGRCWFLLCCSLRHPRCLYSASECCLSRAAYLLQNFHFRSWHLIVSLLCIELFQVRLVSLSCLFRSHNSLSDIRFWIPWR